MAKEVNVIWFGDKVYFNKDGMPHVAFIINHYDDAPNKADLVYYCPVAHAWQETVGVTMGPADGQFRRHEDEPEQITIQNHARRHRAGPGAAAGLRGRYGDGPGPAEGPGHRRLLVLHPSGADDTKALQALYDGALDGDTIRLVPQNGNKRFIISSSLNWTGTKSVNVYAVGAVLYSDMALSGTQAW